MELPTLSVTDLRDLQDSIKQELKKRETQTINDARARILSIAQSVGLSIGDIVSTKSERAMSGTVAVKYRSPTDPSLEWTGRGRAPKWVTAWLEAGNTRESLAV